MNFRAFCNTVIDFFNKVDPSAILKGTNEYDLVMLENTYQFILPIKLRDYLLHFGERINILGQELYTTTSFRKISRLSKLMRQYSIDDYIRKYYPVFEGKNIIPLDYVECDYFMFTTSENDDLYYSTCLIFDEGEDDQESFDSMNTGVNSLSLVSDPILYNFRVDLHFVIGKAVFQRYFSEEGYMIKKNIPLAGVDWINFYLEDERPFFKFGMFNSPEFKKYMEDRKEILGFEEYEKEFIKYLQSLDKGIG